MSDARAERLGLSVEEINRLKAEFDYHNHENRISFNAVLRAAQLGIPLRVQFTPIVKTELLGGCDCDEGK